MGSCTSSLDSSRSTHDLSRGRIMPPLANDFPTSNSVNLVDSKVQTTKGSALIGAMKPELVYIAPKDIGILYPPKQTPSVSTEASLTKACMASLREDKDDLASFKYEKDGISFKVPVLGSPLSSSIRQARSSGQQILLARSA